MYNLTPRFPRRFKKDSSLVGPTTYFISDVTCQTSRKPSCTFASKSNRFLASHDSGTPSPDYYFPKYRKHRILGGKSLQYTTPRVCIVPKKKVQCHLSYTDPFTERFTENVYQTRTSKISQSSLFKRLYRCRKTEASKTVKEILHQVSLSKSLPDYLKFPGEISKASLKYKGSRWAQYTAKRNSLKVFSDTPGPGAYNIPPDTVTKILTKLPPKTINYPKCQPSFEDTQPALQEIDDEEDIIKTTHYFNGTCDYLYKKVSHNKSLSGVWGKSKRFAYDKNENPAPWTYNPMQGTQCHRKIVKIVPFSCCSPRFKSKEDSDLSPASYSQLHKTIKERICGSVPRINRALSAPFGSTAPRLTLPDMHSYSEDEEPEDNDYISVIQLEPEKPTIPASRPHNIKSESSEENLYQVVGTSLVLRDVVEKEPIMVDMRQIYNNLKVKKCNRIQRENEGFLSTIYKRSEWIVQKTPGHDVNWPSLKDVKVPGGAPRMNLPKHEENLKSEKDHSVYYDVHPQFSSSVYRSTHNYRLKPEKENQKTFANPEQVKTILKCFIPKDILYA